MKIVKWIGIIFLVIIILFLIAGFLAPKKYAVERTIKIDAPVEYVYYYCSKLQNFKEWEPWGKRDSLMKSWIEGEDGKVGANYKWEGTKVTGKGEMKITEMERNSRIAYWIHFVEPMEDEATVEMRFDGGDAQTSVTWGFYGKSPFPWNILMLFMNMENMLGKDLEEGLNNLKGKIEKKYKILSSYPIKEIEFAPRLFLSVTEQVKMTEISSFLQSAYGELMEELQKKKIRIAGFPSALYYQWDEQGGMATMAAAIPVGKKIATEKGELIFIGGGHALQVDYYGPYESSGSAHEAMDFAIYRKGKTVKAPVIEEYVTDPGKEPDSSKWLTRIYYFYE